MAHASGAGAGHEGVTQQCLEAADMASAKATAASYLKANCSKNDITRTGDTWTDVTVCKTGAVTRTSTDTTAMTGDSAYHTQVSTTYDPPTATQSASTITVDGKWLGPCKS